MFSSRDRIEEIENEDPEVVAVDVDVVLLVNDAGSVAVFGRIAKQYGDVHV